MQSTERTTALPRPGRSGASSSASSPGVHWAGGRTGLWCTDALTPAADTAGTPYGAVPSARSQIHTGKRSGA